jgi:hypothetical protein
MWIYRGILLLFLEFLRVIKLSLFHLIIGLGQSFHLISFFCIYHFTKWINPWVLKWIVGVAVSGFADSVTTLQNCPAPWPFGTQKNVQTFPKLRPDTEGDGYLVVRLWVGIIPNINLHNIWKCHYFTFLFICNSMLHSVTQDINQLAQILQSYTLNQLKEVNKLYN